MMPWGHETTDPPKRDVEKTRRVPRQRFAEIERQTLRAKIPKESLVTLNLPNPTTQQPPQTISIARTEKTEFSTRNTKHIPPQQTLSMPSLPRKTSPPYCIVPSVRDLGRKEDHLHQILQWEDPQQTRRGHLLGLAETEPMHRYIRQAPPRMFGLRCSRAWCRRLSFGPNLRFVPPS